MLLRATRLCRMSPTMVTFRSLRAPFFSRIVKISSSAWVGWLCAPSPALTTPHFKCLAMKACAPGALWRITIRSTCSDSMLRTVSSRVSPFSRLLLEACIFTMSALRRCSASSKETRVRVLGSTKRLTTVLPRRAGTFFTFRSETFLNSSAVSRRKVISSALRS